MVTKTPNLSTSLQDLEEAGAGASDGGVDGKRTLKRSGPKANSSTASNGGRDYKDGSFGAGKRCRVLGCLVVLAIALLAGGALGLLALKAEIRELQAAFVDLPAQDAKLTQ